MLTDPNRELLLAVAQSAITHGLEYGQPPPAPTVPTVPINRFLDYVDRLGSVVFRPVILAAALDLILFVHRVILEHNQARERSHDVERFR